MTKTKCPECGDYTSSKETPLNREYCVVCDTLKEDKPARVESDW